MQTTRFTDKEKNPDFKTIHLSAQRKWNKIKKQKTKIPLPASL